MTEAVARARYADPGDRQPPGRQAHELRDPQDQRGRPNRGHRSPVRRAPADDLGEHQFRAARVFLGAQRLHAGQDAERRGGDRQRPADPPGAVPGDRQQVVRLTVEQSRVYPATAASRYQQPAITATLDCLAAATAQHQAHLDALLARRI